MSTDEELPFGWRPYTDEHRLELSSAGFTDEQIAQMERSNVYSPPPAGIRAEYIALSVVEVLAKRLGTNFTKQVLETLEKHLERPSAGDAEDQVEGRILAEIKEFPFWKRIGVTD